MTKARVRCAPTGLELIITDPLLGDFAIDDRFTLELLERLKPDCACALWRKAGTVTPFSAEQSVLCSPVCRGKIAKYGHVSRISGERAAKFLCS
jgi:hypothetical protein